MSSFSSPCFSFLSFLLLLLFPPSLPSSSSFFCRYKKTQETLSQAGQKTSAALTTVGSVLSRRLGDMRYDAAETLIKIQEQMSRVDSVETERSQTWISYNRSIFILEQQGEAEKNLEHWKTWPDKILYLLHVFGLSHTYVCASKYKNPLSRNLDKHGFKTLKYANWGTNPVFWSVCHEHRCGWHRCSGGWMLWHAALLVQASSIVHRLCVFIVVGLYELLTHSKTHFIQRKKSISVLRVYFIILSQPFLTGIWSSSSLFKAFRLLWQKCYCDFYEIKSNSYKYLSLDN